MDIFEMLKILKNNPKAIFETNNGDFIFYIDNKLKFQDGCEFIITDYKLNKMTFKQI